MSNMAEVNGSDHLVRPEKEVKLNGYDNEGYHCKERSEEEDESASDDDRLRVVVTENGHRPEDDSPLSNGHVHEESNGHSTTVNGSAVIVLEEVKGDSNMNDNKDESSQKPLDTRLHHYVPVDDIDRKILNGSDGTHVTIPEDAIINFNTGRVKVKKGASNNPPVTNERESIPLETMLPSYVGEDKVGLGEKAELEAELANHKNGLWSEGHNAYSNPEAPFGNSEKLNGTSKSSDEVSLPANNHRKCLSNDVSDTSSEQKSTGEKLYFTEENRKLCPGWRRVFVCGLILIILAVALLLGVLAATGILLAESESKQNTRYESGHSLPSVDTISHAGHSFRPRPSSSKVPQMFLPTVTGNAPLLPPNSTVSGTGDTVSHPPPTVSSKVPVLNDSSHSQTIVPNALVGEFTIDENFTEDLKDSTSDGYRSLANYIERELRGIFKRNGGLFEELKILKFSPGSIKVKFVAVWASDNNVILSQKAEEIIQSYLRKNRNSLLAYPVDLHSIHFNDVFDECRIQKGGCSFNCIWDYNTLSKICSCAENMMLMPDGKSCGPKTSTSYAITTPKVYRTPATTSTTSSTVFPLLTEEFTESAAVQPDQHPLSTKLPTTVTEAISTISELLNILTTTENTLINEGAASVQNLSLVNESSSTSETITESIFESSSTLETVTEQSMSEISPTLETVTEQSISEKLTTIVKDVLTTIIPRLTTAIPKLIHEEITEVPVVTNSSVTENYEISKEFNNTENSSVVSDVTLIQTTTSNLTPETSTQESPANSSNDTSNILGSGYTESHNEFTTTILPTTDPYTIQKEPATTIGYHIENETTEIYTLKGDTEFDSEITTMSALESSKINEPIVTFTEASLHVTSDKTVPKEVKELLLTTEMPISGVITTDFSVNSSETITSYDMTEINDQNTPTEMTNVPLIDTTISAENSEHPTTVKDTTERTVTFINNLKGENYSSTLQRDIFDINVTTPLPKFLSNETEEFHETSITSIPETTTFSIPLLNTNFNRTPEVRSFDEDLENNTFTPTDNFSTEIPMPEASTELDVYNDNSTTTETKLNDTLLMSNPVTTPLSISESVPSTTLPLIVLEKSNSEPPTTNMPDVMDGNKNKTGAEDSVATSTEPILPFTNTPDITETVVNTDSPLKLSTENSNFFSHINLNSTFDTTIPFNESDITILDTAETESLNDTVGITEIPESLLNDSSAFQNFTDLITQPTHSENDSFTNHNGPEILDRQADTTTSLYAETKVPELLETVPEIEISSNINLSNNDSDSELSNSSRELFTENPLLSMTTSEPMNLTNDLTTFENTITTLVPTTFNFNESNVTVFESNENGTLADSSNFASNKSDETVTLTTIQDFTFPTPPTYLNESEVNNITEPNYDAEMFSTINYYNDTLLPGELENDTLIPFLNMSSDSFDGINATLFPGMNESVENTSLIEDFGNFTTSGYEDVTNETTTNASTGIECREDQFLCEPLNVCINDTFLCDGIADCPDSSDEFECKDTCHSNFMCANSSTCIMSDVRCDGIWDCENGTDEDNCTPNECAKHEVMCLDGSKCIKPGHICDWKYNCLDRSDEVGCVERTTCESGGRFFCNDGLCIPWSLKCDGEHDCKDGEDEGNCTCLNDEFQCNDGKCLKSSSRCDGHQDCHDADDEMGCVNVDSQHMVSTFEPYSGSWALLCAEDWTFDDGQYLCRELGFGHALNIEKVHVSFNGTWMAMRRDNLTDSSLWTERVSFVESCTSSLAAAVECQKFQCGEYTGLLHRRKRDVVSSSSSQWPFIGYTSTFYSKKGCLSEILTPIWLITSAECLLSISKEPFNGSDWYVRTKIGLNEDSDLAQNHEVLRIINHPHSSKFRSLTLRDYDVALIRLKHALVFVSDKIGAICPPDEQVPPGITCFSSVLGTEKPRAPPPQSLTINFLALQITDKGNCNGIEHYNGAVNQRMLCTQSSEGHTICDNDEGTPLMCLSGINKWFLAGMLTYQRFCDVYSKHPAVFSNLFSMRKFLDQVTGQKQYEIPYDSNIYVIIPPTTPSPTIPETTTAEVTTIATTEPLILDGTYLTTMEPENVTETMFENFEEINGTTAFNEELAREENVTTVLPLELATDLSYTTLHDMFENKTVPVLYGMDLSVINTTIEESKDELLVNRTHSYLMSLINGTSTEDDADDGMNITDISLMDSNKDFSNLSSFDLITTTPSSIDLTTMDFELNITSPDIVNLTTATERDQMNLFTNETKDIYMSIMLDDNGTAVDSLLVFPLNNSKDDSNPPDSNQNITTTTDLPIISIFNESLEILKPMIALTNESIAISQPLIAVINETAEIESPTTFPTLNYFEYNKEEIMTTNDELYNMEHGTANPNAAKTTEILTTTKIIPTDVMTESETTSFPIIDETTRDFVGEKTELEMTPSPLVVTTTKASAEIKADLETSSRSLANKTAKILFETRTEVETTTSPVIDTTTKVFARARVELETTAIPIIDETTKASVDTRTELETTAIPVTDGTTKAYVDTPTELETTVSSTIDATESFTFEVEGEPDADLAFYIFNNSDGMKFEHYEIPKNNNTSNSYKKNISETDIPVTDAVTDTTSVNETVNSFSQALNISSISSEIAANSTEFSGFIFDNKTGVLNTEAETVTMDYTTPASFNFNNKSDFVMDTTLSTLKNYENITETMPEIETAGPRIEDSDLKMHLFADELTILQDESLENTTDCGIWDKNAGKVNYSDAENFFMQWPALGYLQMIFEPKWCASVIVSSKYVLTSLNCLSFRDNQLDPDKWVYIGGLYSANFSTNQTQNLLISKIIPYPDRNTSLLFNEHDVALVKVKDTIIMNEYSKNACMGKETSIGRDCFSAGWKRNSSDGEYQQQFSSIPLSIIPLEECNSTSNYNGMLLDSLICGSNSNESASLCQMDLGSPLFCLNENQLWEIQGILNFPGSCGKSQPTVFNSIPSARQWIIDTITNDEKLPK